jgi:hypothetical protein
MEHIYHIDDDVLHQFQGPHDVSSRDSLVNIAHFQRFKAATNYGGHTSPRNAFAYPTLAQLEVADATLLFRYQGRP